MGKKKKKTGRGRTATRAKPAARAKPGKGSRGTDVAPDKKHQRQIYITATLIEGLEALRAEREGEMREEFGAHCDLSWSQYVGSVLHDHVRKAKA